MTMTSRAIKLQWPTPADPRGLQADLARLTASDWTPHFNTHYFTGDWSVVALRAPADSQRPQADATQHDYVDTPVLAACPSVQALLASVACPLRGVRLLRLASGSSIREHRDYDLGWDLGEIRIHVPILTNPEVEFSLEGRRIMMGVGEIWALDLSRPHSVHNRGATDRIHLVLDCRLNDWLAEWIAQGEICEGTLRVDPAGSRIGDFEQFHARVLAEPILQRELIGVIERAAFVQRTVELGHSLGFRFLAGDVEAALVAARRSWTATG